MTADHQHLQIWPTPEFSLTDLMGASAPSIATIEGFFEDLYPQAYAVLMPSGRAALHIIIQQLELSRANHVYIPAFASHCVINAVGFLATPCPDFTAKTDASIVFHQWGFPQKSTRPDVIIEDSVDSLIPAGGAIFPNDGRFEILSLPKIFGCLTGGIILCQRNDDAQKLKAMRDQRQELKSSHFMLRVLSQKWPHLYQYWNTVEPLNGYLSPAARRNIFKHVKNIDRIITDRQEKLDMINATSLKTVVGLPKGRFPSCYPVRMKNPDQIPLMFPKNSIRHFPLSEQRLAKVLPIPLHHQISLSTLKQCVVSLDEISKVKKAHGNN